MINISPSDPFASDASDWLADLEYKRPDAETLNFIHALKDMKIGALKGPSSLEDSYKQWDKFTPHQQQLLFPILEQSSLPDEITKAGPKHLDWPEPKTRFAGLGKSPFLKATDMPEYAGPDKIVLTITLNFSYTYVYPQVYVKQEIPKSRAWMGMYYPLR